MTCLYFSPGTIGLVARLFAAAVLGAAIGLERDMHGRPAGLRTHALVSLGSALFTILSYFAAGALCWDGATVVTPPHDPGRIAAQVVTGIGFLGAGTILKSQFSIRGLTTASCLWLVAAIGMGCGMGLFSLAIFTTGLALLFLIAVNHLEHRLPKDQYHELAVHVQGRQHDAAVRDLIRESGAKVLGQSYSYDAATNVSQFRFSLRRREQNDLRPGGEEIITRLEAVGLPLVRVEWDPDAGD
jgi:putative Mg2+ transporter-C (MgtC) family protein